jgi:hypothetical protein
VGVYWWAVSSCCRLYYKKCIFNYKKIDFVDAWMRERVRSEVRAIPSQKSDMANISSQQYPLVHNVSTKLRPRCLILISICHTERHFNGLESKS